MSKSKRIICPYCLSQITYHYETKTCTNNECGQELPIQYVEKYEKAPPLFIQIIGGTSVGKSTYLQALTLMLMKASKRLGAKYAYSPLTPHTWEYVQNVRQFLKDGQVNATSSGAQLSYMMLLLEMDRWQGKTLVISDIAGENFEDFRYYLEYAPYITGETTLLMVSLYDLENSNKAMDDFMASYIETIVSDNKGRRQKKRKVIIVLSKADLIFDDLTKDLQEYLKDDPMLEALDVDKPVGEPLGPDGMENYMTKLGTISSDIENWVKKFPSGQNLFTLAKANNIELRFTLVSSTGIDEAIKKQEDANQPQVEEAEQLPWLINQGSVPFEDTDNNSEQIKPKPVRVLDPFFWLLELNGEPRGSFTNNSNDSNNRTPTDGWLNVIKSLFKG